MAHFAQLDDNNIVVTVIVINNNELLDQDGNEIEQKGIDFCKSLYGQDTNWVQTSYNTHSGVHNNSGTPLRKNFAGIGYTYDAQRDAFISPKPFNSWILNEQTCIWEAPVAYPTDGQRYTWNEEILNWAQITT